MRDPRITTGVEAVHKATPLNPAGVTAITHQDVPVRAVIITTREREAGVEAEVEVAPKVNITILLDVKARAVHQVEAAVEVDQ